VSTHYLVFVSVYALTLVAACLIVLTERGQLLLVSLVERLGNHSGVGPWGLLDTFGYEVSEGEMDIVERAAHAEAYIALAEEQTVRGARVVLWVMIAGCVACAVAAIVIIGVLPPLVVSGVWTYETYREAGAFVIYGTAACGVLMGGGLAAWLWSRTVRLNRTDGCAIARGLLLSAPGQGASAEESAELASGRYPRLSRLLGHASE
jgi:hypothetical protein